ncbi:unnamed protein product [Caenorhabditis angaria]|uniref:Uncharacterized protein n=1 Tax=Caenorhabditis angaria TaxID=860376 RepID=A0A9P1IBC1_9PELO|nr:unnamed protein product [Caenorhabditis angaria]
MMTERIHLEHEGVKTYFFAPLLEYILANDSKLMENEEVNQFASFVLGLSNDFPTASDFHAILVGSNPKNSQIVSAIDSMILFGVDYFETVKQLAEVLGKNGANHDVLNLRLRSNDNETFEKELADHVKNSIIGKVQGSGLLKFFQDMLIVKSASERLDAFVALCAADFDWDAYVFLKLFTNDSAQNEINSIRANIIKKLGEGRSRLAYLWETGKRNDQHSKLLHDLKKPTEDVINLVLPNVIDKIIDIISKDDDETLSKISSLTSQVYFLIFDAVLKGESNKADRFFLRLPTCIKQKMFPAISQTIVKASISLLRYFLPRFVRITNLDCPYDIPELKADGVINLLADPWKRDQLFKMFIDYWAAVSRDVFGFPIDIGYKQEDLLRACQYILDFLRSYDIEKSFFVNSDKMFHLGSAHLTEEQGNIAKVDAPFQEDSGEKENSVVEPYAATPTNYSYTGEEMQNINSQVQQEQQRVHIGNMVHVSSRDIDQGNDEVDVMVEKSELLYSTTSNPQCAEETTKIPFEAVVTEDDVNSLDGNWSEDNPPEFRSFKTGSYDDAPKTAFCKSGRFGKPKQPKQQGASQNNERGNDSGNNGGFNERRG